MRQFLSLFMIFLVLPNDRFFSFENQVLHYTLLSLDDANISANNELFLSSQ